MQAVVAAQAENPDFRFLFDVTCAEHAYYRWRLFSLASGDSMRSWRVEPFTLVEGGPRSGLPHGKRTQCLFFYFYILTHQHIIAFAALDQAFPNLCFDIQRHSTISFQTALPFTMT